jgi:hypothetical protein
MANQWNVDVESGAVTANGRLVGMLRGFKPSDMKLIGAAPALLEAAKVHAGFSVARPSDDAPCHVGLVPKERCGRCQRAAALYAAIEAAE